MFSQIVLDADAGMTNAFNVMGTMLTDGRAHKRTILEAFGDFELVYYASVDLADRAVDCAIEADTGATEQERDNLRSKVADVTGKWAQMVECVQQGIWMFSIVQPDTSGWIH